MRSSGPILGAELRRGPSFFARPPREARCNRWMKWMMGANNRFFNSTSLRFMSLKGPHRQSLRKSFCQTSQPL